MQHSASVLDRFRERGGIGEIGGASWIYVGRLDIQQTIPPCALNVKYSFHRNIDAGELTIPLNFNSSEIDPREPASTWSHAVGPVKSVVSRGGGRKASPGTGRKFNNRPFVRIV